MKTTCFYDPILYCCTLSCRKSKYFEQQKKSKNIAFCVLFEVMRRNIVCIMMFISSIFFRFFVLQLFLRHSTKEFNVLAKKNIIKEETENIISSISHTSKGVPKISF